MVAHPNIKRLRKIPYAVALVSWVCGSALALIIIGHQFGI
jgi:hypothetical protein